MAIFGISLGSGLARADTAVQLLPPAQAHARVEAGTITLVDVRTPREWAQTGIAENAATIMLQDPDFLTRLEALLGGDRSRPVAFICRSGNRSGKAARMAMAAGYTEVYNVPYGMATPGGWIDEGLPVVAYEGG